ncbi:MAG TPA: cyclase family protein [Bacillota bacterium]|nr:cyclase family protein [Bacillota bacterium]
MEIIDISQELFSSVVFPGDTPPTPRRVMSISNGDAVNLTDVTMCAHNGTHIDAPCHFIDGGASVEQLDLHRFVGTADVITVFGVADAETLSHLIPLDCKRLLIRGADYITPDGARLIVEQGILLVGVEAQSVGDPKAPRETHIILLSSNVGILEGLRLKNAPDGRYFLSAAPINMGGSDGAPCRAVLISDITTDITL